MRIERLQHAVDGAVDQPVRRHVVDVFAIDRGERRREHAILLLDLVLRGERRAAEQAAGERRQQDRQNRHGQETGLTHMIGS